MKEYISKRKECPLCLSSDLSNNIYPHINLKFPILPVCVDTPAEEDMYAPFTICMCNDCGLIMLRDIVDPKILYKIFHSDGIGEVWDEHYEKFVNLIKKYYKGGRILEVGSGQGKLIKKLLLHYNSGIEVIDPQYEGTRENVKVHNKLFNNESSEEFKEEFDAIVSSHTLEHFIEFKDYFENSWKSLKKEGLLFTTIPNQETNFAKGYGNQLNFEHPSVCTNTHWIYLHYKYGFVIKEIAFFRDHSIQIVAKKVEESPKYNIDVKEFSQKILEEYYKNIETRIDKVRRFAKKDKENWIFGASNFTQPLFVYGLEENHFNGVMDNSPLKHNKRLYGTNLICKSPEEIVPKKDNLRIFLNLAHYNQEVFEQLKKINTQVECIFL